jgi:hypothetical protein
MTSGLTVLFAATFAATVVALVVYLLPMGPVHTGIRRLALLVFNLSPWTIGLWRSSFTRRETALAAWFLCSSQLC